MFAIYKNKDELKLKFKLLNLSFVSLFLYFMILQSYGNIVNFGGIQNSVSIENSRSISKTKTETNNNSNLANGNLNTNPNSQLNLASINSGKITANGDININSNNFINQTLFTNDKANLNANNIFINAMANISNLGADIVAKDNLVLNANDDIINSTNLNYYANDYRKTYSTTTGGELKANNILINADNFTNISANINANDNLQIKAKNDINNNYLQSITTTYQGNASNYTKTENKKAILGDIKANNINLISGNDINLAGISLKAKENLNILAGNDINILAAKNSSYKESGSYKSGFFSSKEEITINQSNTHTNSKLNANNINLASNSDINLFGVDLDSNDEINLRAGGDITQASVKDSSYYYHKQVKSSFFGLNQSLHEKESYNEKALISQAIANDGSLTYNAKNNLLLSGVKTYSNKDTNLNADNINITSLELNSFSNEVNKKSKFNLGGFLFETGLKIPLAFSGVILPTDSTEIYKSELHEKQNIKTTNQASSLNANANININSNNDITIKGSNLNSNNNINLNSQSANINILASQDIAQTKTKDEVKRIEIGGANDFIKTLIDDIKNTSIQGHSTVAKIEKSNDDTTKTTITNNSSNLNADNININSNLNTNIKASNLNANDSINISSTNGDINILSDKNLNQSTENSNLKETIHFVDYKSDNTNLDQTNISSNIISDNINLNANEITLKASNIIANESIQIDTTRLNLISDKDNHTSISNSNNKDTLIAEVKSQGKITEIEIPAIIEVGDKFILNGKDITDKLDTKVYQTISNSLNDNTIKDSIIKSILSNSNIPLDEKTINQIKATLNNDEWDKSTKSLSTIGAIVVTIVVTIFTAGTAAPAASSALVGTTSAAATTTTAAVTAAAIESATSAVISNLAVQSANMALSKGEIKFDLNSLINSTATATLGSLASGLTNNIDIASGSINNNYLNINYNDIAKQTLNSVAKAGIQSGIYNTDFKDSLIANLTNQVTDTIYNQVGHASGSLETINSNKYFQDGGLGKIALHSLTGGISSELMGDKFATGAISAGLNEALSPLFSKDTNTMSKDELAKYNAERLAISQLIGTISGGWINGEAGANTAFTISTSAAINNRQMHQREIDWINANAEKFAKELYGDNPTQSQIYDAKARLAQEGVRKVDLMGFLALGEHDIVAYKFIKENAPSDLFIVKNEYEYKDATINLSNLSNKEFENLNNFYNQYLYTITSQNKQGFDFVGSRWQKYANKNFDNAINNFSFTDTILNLPNSIVDFIVDIPDKAQSTITYAQSIFPTTTNDRLNTLYGDNAANIQASIQTMDTIDILGLGIGVAELTNLSKNAIKDRLAKSDTAVENTIKGADSAVNIANYMKYKDELLSNMGKVSVKDKNLQNIIDFMYRPNAEIGSGSTADAVRYELKTGNKVGGKNHLQKAQDSIKALEKWIKNNPNANKSDIDTAQKYIKDLNNALNGN